MFPPCEDEPFVSLAEIVANLIESASSSARRLAFHEAGHAVAIFALRGVACTVEIGHGHGFASESRELSVEHWDAVMRAVDEEHERRDRWFDSLQPHEREGRELFASRLITEQQILLAGPLAEGRHAGIELAEVLEGSGRIDRREWESCERLLVELRNAERAIAAAVDTEAATRSLLEDRWPSVERLADVLATQRRLEPAAVKELLR